MKKLLVVVGFVTSVQAQHFFGMYDGYEPMIQPSCVAYNTHKFQARAFAECAYDTTGFNGESEQVGILEIYEPSQSILTMFQGVNQSNAFTTLVNGIVAGSGGGITDVVYIPKGSLLADQVVLQGSYALHPYVHLRAQIPVRYAKLYNVSWKATGQIVSFADLLIQNQIINTFEQTAKELFGLDLTGWKQTGFGETSAVVEYEQTFRQYKKFLRFVTPHLHVGLEAPTGKQGNSNTIMPTSFDYDGAWGFVFGGGLDLDLAAKVQIGFRADFKHYFSTIKQRRVKTFASQTTLLQPKVASVWKNYGFVQNFILFAQLKHIYRGLSLKGAYSYYRKGTDSISLNDSSLDWTTINGSLELEEQTRHYVLVAAMYDTGYDAAADVGIRPQVELFWKMPVHGARVALASTIGVGCSFDF